MTDYIIAGVAELPFENDSFDLVTAFKTIYNAVQILNALNEVGFSNAHVNKNEKGWICVIATKQTVFLYSYLQK